MRIVDLVLHPGTLLLLSAAAVITSLAMADERSSALREPQPGVCGGLLLFAATALIAAVIRRGQMPRED